MKNITCRCPISKKKKICRQWQFYCYFIKKFSSLLCSLFLQKKINCKELYYTQTNASPNQLPSREKYESFIFYIWKIKIGNYHFFCHWVWYQEICHSVLGISTCVNDFIFLRLSIFLVVWKKSFKTKVLKAAHSLYSTLIFTIMRQQSKSLSLYIFKVMETVYSKFSCRVLISIHGEETQMNSNQNFRTLQTKYNNLLQGDECGY